MESSEQFRLRYLEQIRTARLELSMTQVEFAEFVGVSVRTVQQWERGENLPQPRHRKKLDKVIKVAGERARTVLDNLATVTLV